jgi:hypothetical protein
MAARTMVVNVSQWVADSGCVCEFIFTDQQLGGMFSPQIFGKLSALEINRRA